MNDEININKKYVTEDGDEVELVAIRPELKEYQVVGIVDKKFRTWTISGKYYNTTDGSLYDLKEVEE